MHSTMQDVPLSISSILRYGSTVHADRQVFTVREDGYRVGTFADVAQGAGQLANALRRLGVDGDQRVATFQWNNQEHLEAYLAIPAMGAVLHTLNIRLTPEQIAYIANHAEDRVVIVDASLAPLLGRSLPAMETVRTVITVGSGDVSSLQGHDKTVLSYEDIVAAESPEFAWPEVDERSAAAMCYTSGTTGSPKGVVYSHRSMYLHSMAACTANGLDIGQSDRILPIVPMFHANAWGLPYAALMAGADLVMPDRFLQAAPLVEMIERLAPTVAGAVPTIWNDVLVFLQDNPGRDVASLRLVACGGSAVPRSLMEEFEKKHDVVILQAWGMTETSPLAAVARPPAGVAEEAHWSLRCTAGRVVSGVEARIVSDDGEVLANDGASVGELEVRGPWITGSYYRDADPAKFDNGWLRTGDVGRIDEQGFITLTDRAKDVIKSGGEWISSVELENHLAGHPSVLEAAVVGVPDEKWQERPLAVVVVKEGEQVSPAELRSWLTDKVAKWWLPERWTFVDQVPRTSVGKYDKKVLRHQVAEGFLDVQEVT